MFTKGQVIERAFEEIGLAAYWFDITPAEQVSALKKLDAMMAQWEAKGIRVGYGFPSSPEGGNVADDTGCGDQCFEAMGTNLAIRLAPGFGKTLSPVSTALARTSYSTLLAKIPIPQQQLAANLPTGAGAKYWRGPNQVFIPPPSSDVDNANSTLDFIP